MLSLESPPAACRIWHVRRCTFKRFFSLDELVESIEKVTAADVQRVAQTFFEQKQIALTILGQSSMA